MTCGEWADWVISDFRKLPTVLSLTKGNGPRLDYAMASGFMGFSRSRNDTLTKPM